MRQGHASTLHRNLQSLFESGTCTGLSDAELIDRFVDRRGHGHHLAFETLVTRHGPMVLRVCRGILRDSHDAQDACQAVFLILAQRARSIRNRDFLAGWLYRIAVRVAHRRRAIKNREPILVSDGAALGSLQISESRTPQGYDESAEIVQEEVNRLDRNLREPVILCYFEGLSHDEAAERLHWPVGTVRSRLARARDRLRVRLRRRGVTGSGTGALGVWINLDPSIPIDAASARLVDFVSSAPLPSNFVSATVDAASRLIFKLPDQTNVLPASATVTLLASGAMQSMFYEKLMIATLVFVPLGVLAVGGGTMLGQSAGPKQPADVPTAAASDAPSQPVRPRIEPPPAPAPPPVPIAVDDEDDKKLREVLIAAKRRYEAQKPPYEEGRITINRFLDAITLLGDAEKAVEKSHQGQLEAQQLTIERIENVVGRERAELKVGKGTTSDVAEAEQSLRRAQLELRSLLGFNSEFENLHKNAMERYELQKAHFEEGRITIDRYLDSIAQLGKAEMAMGKTDGDRIASKARTLQRLDQLLKREKDELKAGKSTDADVSEIELRRLQVELELTRMKKDAAGWSTVPKTGTKPGTEIVPNVNPNNAYHTELAALKKRVSELESKLNMLLQIKDDKPKR